MNTSFILIKYERVPTEIGLSCLHRNYHLYLKNLLEYIPCILLQNQKINKGPKQNRNQIVIPINVELHYCI